MTTISTWRALAAIALSLALASAPQSGAATATPTVLTGTVVDEAGQPVPGATVETHSNKDGLRVAVDGLKLDQRVVTDATGHFTFELPARNDLMVIARKPGLAPAWKQLARPSNTPLTLVLSKPSLLAGVVLDEADQPVAEAEVSVVVTYSETVGPRGARAYSYLTEPLARDFFSARTDANGQFRIEGFPDNSSANLVVRAPGKALRQPSQTVMSPDSMQYHSGQEDIRLVLEPTGRIEGKLLIPDLTHDLPTISMTLEPDGPNAFGTAMDQPTTANPDGSFRISNVGAGNYNLRAQISTNSPPDWIVESTPVSVNSGETITNIVLQAIRGELLEATVLQQESRQPAHGATVYAYKQGFQSSAMSDATGNARLRLPPGDYQVAAAKEDSTANSSTTIEANQLNHVELELEGPRTLAGVVRRPDGQAAPGLALRVVGSFAPDMAESVTDANGKFQLEWDPRQFHGHDSTPCLLVRDPEHNLAVAHDLEEESEPLDLSLEPAMSLVGKAECDGKPVTNATASLIYWTGNTGMHLPDVCEPPTVPGRFEIRALPLGRRYGLQVSAPGHGQRYISTVDSHEAKPLELEPVELKPAVLQLAGQVLDADDTPVIGASVQLHGDGQPATSARTDRDGRFIFTQVCEGSAQIMAHTQGSHASITAEGGDTNVVLRLGEDSNVYSGSVKRQIQGIVTDPENQPVAEVQVAVFPFNEAQAKTDAKGAFKLTYNIQPWQIQSGGDPCLVLRHPARNLAAAEFVTVDNTNVTVQLQPASTITGRVEGIDGQPLPKAQVGLWLLACRSYNQLDEQLATTDTNGLFNIRTVPPGLSYIVFATAKGYGRQQQPLDLDSESSPAELPPFTLKVANLPIAGQVVDDREKPVSGAHVSVSGDDQPDASATTDSKGRFNFMVCEGRVQLFAGSDSAYANTTADPGDTNIIVRLNRNDSSEPQSQRAPLTGKLLPDPGTVGLSADAIAPGKPLLLCLFDAEQRPSRRAVRLLTEQFETLTAKGIAVVAVQSAVTTDDTFQEWKQTADPPFPIGRLTAISPGNRWATDVQSLPWLILTDATGKVTCEGFSIEELETRLEPPNK